MVHKGFLITKRHVTSRAISQYQFSILYEYLITAKMFYTTQLLLWQCIWVSWGFVTFSCQLRQYVLIKWL